MGQYIWIKKIFPHIQFNMTEHDMTVQSYERKLEECYGIKSYVEELSLRQLFLLDNKGILSEIKKYQGY